MVALAGHRFLFGDLYLSEHSKVDSVEMVHFLAKSDRLNTQPMHTSISRRKSWLLVLILLLRLTKSVDMIWTFLAPSSIFEYCYYEEVSPLLVAYRSNAA